MQCTNTDKQKELENCTFVKTVLMVIIVFYHSILHWSGNWFLSEPADEIKPITLLAQWLNSFHVYGFVLISGYLFYYLKYELGKYQHFGRFVAGKAKRLLIPYCFVAAAWVLPANLLWDDTDVVSNVLGLMLGTSPSQLWFLLMLFGVFIIAWPLSDWFERHNLWAFVIGVALYGIGYFGLRLFPNLFQVWTALRYVIYFLVGFKIRQLGSDALSRIPGIIWLLVHIGVFAAGQLLSGESSFIMKLLESGISIANTMVGALMSFVVLQKVALRVQWKRNVVLKWLHPYSMAIYLFHQQIVYLFIVLFKNKLPPLPHAMINFTGSLALSVLLAKMLMKFKPTRFFIGEK